MDSYRQADKKKIFELAFYGGSFTALSAEKQGYYLEIASSLKEEKKISKIRFSTRPDAINHEILQRARRYGVDIIELGLQSMQDEILLQAERGHKAQDTIRASALIKEYDFSLGLQIMPGLKGDSRESIEDTFLQVKELKPDFVRIYPALVIKGTKLEEEFLQSEFIPFDLDQMVDLVASAYQLLSQAGIKVIRMGLQGSENLTKERDLVAGPWHPAFGELVFSEIYRRKLLQLIEEKKPHPARDFILRINPSEESKLRGQKNKNIQLIKEKHKISLKIEKDEKIEKGKIETEV